MICRRETTPCATLTVYPQKGMRLTLMLAAFLSLLIAAWFYGIGGAAGSRGPALMICRRETTPCATLTVYPQKGMRLTLML
ncbi:hypothetical protein CJ307_34475, partial [Klebsiella quasipneumoniae]